MKTKQKQKLGPNQRKLLRALESKKFKHAKGKLAKKVKGEWRHCCLGVACEIFGEKSRVLGGFKQFGSSGESDVATPNIIKALSLRSAYGETKDGRELTAINDKSNRGYRPVINLIKNHPELVFKRAK